MSIEPSEGVVADAELIAAVRAGEASAFAELYERHAGAALVVAVQHAPSRAEAEDVVSDAFAAVFSALQRGSGPTEAFRAYLFTVVRRMAADARTKVRRAEPTDDLAVFESAGVAVAAAEEPALEGFEHGIVSKAFASLPERWQAVLWHTEVEGLAPAQVAPLLGLTANGAAALAYRAREGLRQAYLQQHLQVPVSDECRKVADKLGAYARGGLGVRENRYVEAHLEGCGDCRALALELADVNHGMRAVIAPLVLGTAGLAALGYTLPVHGGLAAGAALLDGVATGALAGGLGTGAAGAHAAGHAGSASAASGAVGGPGAASGSAAGSGAAGGGAAGSGAAGGGAGAGGAAAGAAAGGAASGGVLAAIGAALAAIPPAAAAVVVGIVVVGAAVAVAVNRMSDDQAVPPSVSTSAQARADQSTPGEPPSSAAPSPASTDAVLATPPLPAPTTSIRPATTSSATPSATATAAAEPTATPTPPAPTPAHVELELPAGGLVLAAGAGDQELTFGIRNSGEQSATDLVATVELPAGVSLTGIETQTPATAAGMAVPGVEVGTWACAPTADESSAQCTLDELPGLTLATLVVTVSVDESYDQADGQVSVRIEGAGLEPIELRGIPVQVSAAPARLLLESAPRVRLLVGRESTVLLPVHNAGGEPAQGVVEASVPDGVRAGGSGDGWSCAGTTTLRCTADVPARTTMPLRVTLAADRKVAGDMDVSLQPARSGAQEVSLALDARTAATVVVQGPDTASLALGRTTEVTYAVSDDGDLDATAATVTVTRPVGASWATPAASGDGWSCPQPAADDTTLTCTRQGLDAGTSVPLVVRLDAVRAVVGDLGSLSAVGTADDADPAPAAVTALDSLAPSLSVVGTGSRLLLQPGEVGTLRAGVRVADADAAGVRVTFRLPTAVVYAPGAGADETPGCTRGATARDVVCDLGDLPAGTDRDLLVTVRSTGAAVSGSARVVATAVGVSASGSAPVVASSGGLTPRFHVTGDVSVSEVGAPLMSCGTSSACRTALTSSNANNNSLAMSPLDEAPPVGVTRGARASSSSATLDTAGRPVLFAGLYWSAARGSRDAWSGSRTNALIAGPDGTYQSVRGELLVDDLTDNGGRRYYQSFADVTDLVAKQGGGTWSLADIALAATQRDADPSYYGGWALVVVLGTADEAGAQSATVYDGGSWVANSSTAPAFDFVADAGTQVRVGVVGWDGDVATTGDRVRLDGIALVPLRADGRGSANNALASTATGWRWPNSLGVDAKAFQVAALAGEVGSITVSTGGDQFLIGAVTTLTSTPR